MEDERKRIASAVDIVDVISSYISLQKKGNDYIGVCPFHDDHSPSMHVSPRKQIYKCFACGAGGDVIQFVKEFEQISYQQAIAKVAKLAHIDYRPARTDQEHQEVRKLHQLLDAYANYANYLLLSPQGKEARDYLESRGITETIIQKFQLGYVPEKESSNAFFTARKFDPVDLYQTGLIQEPGDYDSSLSPVFSNRILIPLHNDKGEITGFSARCLPGSSQVKYINTRTTPLYDKSSQLFNFHRAKEAAKKAGRVILVEGAMDVIGLAKAGIEEGVASLGVHFTDQQIRLIASLHVSVLVLYDQDEAGRKACLDFAREAVRFGLSIEIGSLPDGKDPDEYVNLAGARALREALTASRPLVDFLFEDLQARYNFSNYADLTQIQRILFPFYDHLVPEERRRLEQIYSQLSQKPFPSRSSFVSRFEESLQGKQMQTFYLSDQTPLQTNGCERAQELLIAALLEDPSLYRTYKSQISFNPGKFSRLYLYYQDYLYHNINGQDSFLDYIPDEELKDYAGEFLSRIDFQACVRAFREAMHVVFIHDVKHVQHNIKQRLGQTEDEEARMELLRQFVENKKAELKARDEVRTPHKENLGYR